MSRSRHILWPIGAGMTGMVFMTGLYLGILSIAESPRYATNLMWSDRYIVIPIILGFGIQTALYVILKKRLFLPVANIGPSGAITGASGTTSTLAMVACCAHHVSDVLPILGMTAAAAFLAEYRVPFMLIGLGMTLFGIGFMTVLLIRERRRAMLSLHLLADAR